MIRLETQPRRVAVFRALQLGDMLCAVPALRALRNAWSHAQITLIGLPWARAFVARYRSLVDDFIAFPGAPGFPEQDESGAGLARFIEEARSRRFDVAIQMHGSGSVSNDIVVQLGARSNAGFVQPGETRDGLFMPWPERGPEVERYLALVRFMGLEANDATLCFPLTAEDDAECDDLLRDFAITSARAVIVHAGAQLPSRRWPPRRFAAVADALARDGYHVLLTGTPAEAALVRALRTAMSHPAMDLCGKTTLGCLAALVSRVPLVVCNDTGISHLAAALRTPSVVVACGSDTARWRPADTRLHRVLFHDVPCRPCAHPVCPTQHECALGVGVQAVVAAARGQLALGRNRPHAQDGGAQLVEAR